MSKVATVATVATALHNPAPRSTSAKSYNGYSEIARDRQRPVQDSQAQQHWLTRADFLNALRECRHHDCLSRSGGASYSFRS